MSRTAAGKKPSIAIIGAGMSGLAAAAALVDAGHAVTVFDKARGVGGRTSLRRGGATSPDGESSVTFDHGAQYFTARDPRFRRFVDAWVKEGVAARFEGEIVRIDAPGEPEPRESDGTERFVGVPGMNALAKRMARGLDVRVRSRVSSVERDAGVWSLHFDDGTRESGYDTLLVTTPPAQAVRLVSASAELVNAAEGVTMNPCWAVMLHFGARVPVDFDGAFVNAGPLSWVCRNSAKAGRMDAEAWVLHASAEWTRAHLEDTPDDVAAQLTSALQDALGQGALPPVLAQDSHRWMYSGAAEPLEVGALYDSDLGLGLAGDWLNGAKVQGAWLSGQALAGHVLRPAPSPDDRSFADPKRGNPELSS